MKTKKQTIKQKMVATTVLLFMLLMMFGSLNLPGASATVTTTNLIQNFITGGFGHEAIADLVYADLTVGTATVSNANMIQTNVWDFRGSGAGWTITGTSSYLNIITNAAGVNNISNAFIYWNPPGGAIIAITGVDTGITLGTLQAMSGAGGVALVTAAPGSGMGNYSVNNVIVNIVYNGRTDQLVGAYRAILTMTSA